MKRCVLFGIFKNKIKNKLKKETFLIACFIALIGSLGNVLHGTFLKYYSTTLNINLYELITFNCIVEVIILFPFCIKYFKKLTKDFSAVLLLSLLYSADILLYNTGLKTTPVNTGVLIMLLVPLWMCVLGRAILKEKGFHLFNIIALLCCIFAVILTIYGDFQFSGFSIGVVLIFINSIVLPLGVILQKKFGDKRPITYALFTNAIALGIVSFCMSGCKTNALQNINFDLIKAGFFIAIFDIMECGGVYLSCKLANVALLQPMRFTRIIFAVFVSQIVLGETLTIYQIIGAIIIFIANFLAIFVGRFSIKNNVLLTTTALYHYNPRQDQLPFC